MPRILTKFKINEISAVTRPAQEGARMVLMKRDERPTTFLGLLEEEERNRREYEKSEKLWPLFTALQETIRKIVADQAPSKVGRVNRTIEQFREEVKKKIPDAEIDVDKLFTKMEFVMPKDGTPTVEELLAKVADLEILAKMSDEEKEYCSKMGSEDKKKFMEKSPEDRKTAMKKVEDEVIKSDDGTIIRKSVVGEGTFAFLKHMQAKDVERQAEIAKLRDEKELETFSKSADTDYKNLPGLTLEKAKALRAVSKLDDESKATIEKMLKGGQAALVLAGKPVGAPSNGVDGSPYAKIQAKAEELRKSNPKLTKEASEAKVIAEDPELYKQYQDERRAH